jgi:hypothetical protein
MDLPTPAFQIGQSVRALLNEHNRTVRVGRIRAIVWHSKAQRYNYYIEVSGKKVSKRYLAVDLIAVDPPEGEQCQSR